MNTTINNNGDGNLINTGNNSTVSNNVSVFKGNKELLKEVLTTNQVEETDTDELLKIIDTETPVSASTFGNKVNDWVLKMMGKVVDGSWKIGLSAAGGVLAKAIGNYYGIGN